MMSHIGSVIREVRCGIGMSRNELSVNICSEKYLYLIESGKRTPSAEILRLLSNKLGTDLFEYYEYLDCADPVKVCEAIKKFNIYRSLMEIEELRKISGEMAALPDFQKKPWKYELEVNKISYMLFAEHKYKESEYCIEELLQNIEPVYKQEEFTANLYILLSTIYQIYGNISGSEKVLSAVGEILKNKQNFSRYNQIIVSYKLNIMTLCHLNGQYDTAVKEGLWIYNLRLSSTSYDRSNFTFYYLAYAYYKKGMTDEAFEWFEKCLYNLLITYSPVPAYYISNYDLFYEMLGNKRISPELLLKIKNKYKFIN